ncbi:MAG: RND transporter, partial [Acidobacteria bacterium]|nr:RND transporter [Acidobacteriota bacterium]MBV8858082.1 RND transporter [Acidobacteriota bacterium]
DGREAERVQVKLGRTSVNTVEVLEGLREGDTVILSDTAQWDGLDRLRLD